METEIQELAGRTSKKLKKLTEEEFAGLVFLPAEYMGNETPGNGSLYTVIPRYLFYALMDA